MKNIIPRELINKNNVQIYVDGQNIIHIKFSQQLKNELNKWPKRRLRDLMHDIKVKLEYIFLFQPICSWIIDQMYDRVFVTLRQVY